MNNRTTSARVGLYRLVRLAFRWLVCVNAFAIINIVAWRVVMPSKPDGAFDIRGVCAWALIAMAASVFSLRKPNAADEARR